MILGLRLTLLSPLATLALASAVLEPRNLVDVATFAAAAAMAVLSALALSMGPVAIVLCCAVLVLDRRAA